MPAEQRGYAYRLGPHRWGLQYRDETGQRRRQSPFPSKSAALAWYRDEVEPRRRGERSTTNYTLAEFVPVYLERHVARERTIETLRERLKLATAQFGDIPLRELEAMTSELAGWYARLPERSRYGVMSALRQTLNAAVRWRHMGTNPAVTAVVNRAPSPREIRIYTMAELEAIALELPRAFAAFPMFAAGTGLRPEELAALQRKDIDRRNGVLNVSRTVTGGKGTPIKVVELAKTDGSRRQVPFNPRALQALDSMPVRIDIPLLFPSPGGAVLNLDNFRRRQWSPAVELAGVAKPARIYDLRSTFASDSLAAGITVFELARIMGTSVRMIERHYGRLVGGAAASIAARQAAYYAEQQGATAAAQE